MGRGPHGTGTPARVRAGRDVASSPRARGHTLAARPAGSKPGVRAVALVTRCHPRVTRHSGGPVTPSLVRAGGFLCLTTRSNPSNLRYKAELEAALQRLEQQGAWQKVLAQEVERWERATEEEESVQGTGYISGVVYIYRKCPVPPLEEG